MKKQISFLTAVSLALGISAVNVSAAAVGDVNNDGNVSVSDISLIAAKLKGKRALSSSEEAAADVNGDGNVTVTDISAIAAHIKGIKSLGGYEEIPVSTEEIYAINKHLTTIVNLPNGVYKAGAEKYVYDYTTLDKLRVLHYYMHCFGIHVDSDDDRYRDGFMVHTLEQLNELSDRFFGTVFTHDELASLEFDGGGYLIGGTYYDASNDTLCVPLHNGEGSYDLILCKSVREINGKLIADIVDLNTPYDRQSALEYPDYFYEQDVNTAYSDKETFTKKMEGTAVLKRHTTLNGETSYVIESLSLKKVLSAYNFGELKAAFGGNYNVDVIEGGQASVGAMSNDDVFPHVKFCVSGNYKFLPGNPIEIDKESYDELPDYSVLSFVRCDEGAKLGDTGAVVGMRYSELKKYFDLSGTTRFENHCFTPNYVVDIDGENWMLVFDMEGKWSGDFGLKFIPDKFCSEEFRFEDFGLDPVCKYEEHKNKLW